MVVLQGLAQHRGRLAFPLFELESLIYFTKFPFTFFGWVAHYMNETIRSHLGRNLAMLISAIYSSQIKLTGHCCARRSDCMQ